MSMAFGELWHVEQSVLRLVCDEILRFSSLIYRLILTSDVSMFSDYNRSLVQR